MDLPNLTFQITDLQIYCYNNSILKRQHKDF